MPAMIIRSSFCNGFDFLFVKLPCEHSSSVEDRRLPPQPIVAWSLFQLLVSSAKHVYVSAAARCRGWKYSITLYLKKVEKAKEFSHVRNVLAHSSS